MATPTPLKLVEKFREDAALLLSFAHHTQVSIAQALKIDESHLSRCLSNKNPGKKLIERFNKLYGDEIEQLRRQPFVQDLIQPYNLDITAYVKNLNDNIAELKTLLISRQDQQEDRIAELHSRLEKIEKTLSIRKDNK